MKTPARPESRITVNPRGPIRLQVGDRLYISCTATGNPTPSVEWIYPQRRILGVPVGADRFDSMFKQTTFVTNICFVNTLKIDRF